MFKNLFLSFVLVIAQRNYLEAPQKYNPWNPAAFDTNDVQATTNLGCSLTSSGTTMTCSGHNLPLEPELAPRVLKLTSGPQSGEIRTVRSAPTSSTTGAASAKTTTGTQAYTGVGFPQTALIAGPVSSVDR
ncbi:MAG: hypothetical protein LC794_00490 [Acidobacteria bacterium]|nr:hypothetical protein [Acidobacteriota bacterium]